MSYQLAKARTRSKYLHSAIITPADPEPGVHVYILAQQAGRLIPFGRTWHETEEAAKADCAQTLKIRATDWITHDGEPEWAGPMREAVEKAIGRAGRPQ